MGKAVAIKKAFEEEGKGDSGKDVYFISLVGASKWGKPDKRRHVFDVITDEYEFTQTGHETTPIFVDIPKLMDHYLKHQPLGAKALGVFKTLTVYDLLAFFISRHPDSHYVIDEVPMLPPDNRHPGKNFSIV